MISETGVAGWAYAPDAEYTEMDPKNQTLLTVIFISLPTLFFLGAGVVVQRAIAGAR